ncbi:MAG: hypothetical protein BAJALOKI3v1_30120 [Promethearchaeota archaeon]|jgi:hypothetical protein|nr:MAG: hypothetical protein BAJALOKI3v1_30120 [Candidatus Lokiarchaeota archaeon]
MFKEFEKIEENLLSHSRSKNYDFEDVGNVFPDNKDFIKILKRKLIRENFISIEDK